MKRREFLAAIIGALFAPKIKIKAISTEEINLIAAQLGYQAGLTWDILTRQAIIDGWNGTSI